MKSLIKKKSLKMSIYLLVALNLLFVAGLTAMAADDDLVFDNYDRSTLSDFASSNAGAQWTGGDAGKSAAIDNNALKLEYGSEGWFGTGGGIDASGYKYLVIRIKGAAGGEGADFDLNYAVGETVKTTGKTFADLASKDITKEYQDIAIDLAANKIDKGIQALHFNFHNGTSGTIWIDSISFSNTAGSKATPAKDKAGTGDAKAADSGTKDKPAAASNPKTGDSMNMTMYVWLAMISGMTVVALTVKARRAKQN